MIVQRQSYSWGERRTLQIRIKAFKPGYGFASIVAQTAETSACLEGRGAFAMYSVEQAAQGIHVRGREQLLVKSILRRCDSSIRLRLRMRGGSPM